MTNSTKFVKCLCESGYEIKELDLTKLETDHGNGTYSSTCIYFVYIFFWRIRSFFFLQKKSVLKKRTVSNTVAIEFELQVGKI